MRKYSHSYSRYHLRWACFFARKAAEIENRWEDDDLSTDEIGIKEVPTNFVHQGYVVHSIIGAFSFLEGSANEAIALIEGELQPTTDEVEEVVDDWEFPALLQELHEINENPFASRLPTLKKYQMILVLSGNTPFEMGGQPFQDMDTIRALRNYFVHYELDWITPGPSDDSEHIEHEIGSRLQGKFELSPLVGESPEYFPTKCLSYGCAKWSIERSIEFTDQFYDRLLGTELGHSTIVDNILVD